MYVRTFVRTGYASVAYDKRQTELPAFSEPSPGICQSEVFHIVRAALRLLSPPLFDSVSKQDSGQQVSFDGPTE